MPTILIGGYYGAGNIGDESILVSMVSGLRAQRSDISFIVTSWDPEKTRISLDVEAVYYNDINGLLDAALRADMIILGGGGIFHDYWGLDPDTYLRRGYWDLTFFGSMPLLAKLLDIPCMIYAVGVGPFQTDLARQHARLAFERCQIATVRDEKSLETLRQTGFKVDDSKAPPVKVLPDPVFVLTTTPSDDAEVSDFLKQRGISTDTQLLGVSLRYWDLECPLEEWLPYIAHGVNIFLNQNEKAQAILIPYQVAQSTAHTNDAIVLKRLADLIGIPDRVHWIDRPLQPHFVQALIKHCTALLGMRLHSVIMSLNVGTPVVALSYAPKVQSVMKLVGLEKFCNTSLRISAVDLAAQLNEVWGKKDEFRFKIKPIQEGIKEEAKLHTSFALDLLSRSHRSELQFSQEFALQQVRLLMQADDKLTILREEKRIAEQAAQAQLAEKEFRLNEIVTSKAYQAALLIRRARMFIAPPGSFQAKMIQWAIKNIFVPLKKIRMEQKLKNDLAEIKSSNLFDAEWYLAHNPDIAQAKTDPALHYLQYGGLEERDPGPNFSSSWYLNMNQDVKNARVNPLFHYLKYGKFENRSISTVQAAQSINLQARVINLIGELNNRSLRGVIVIASMFQFDEQLDQRDTNLCKALSAQGWGVIFVTWQGKDLSSIGGEVYKNIFQISKDMLLETVDLFYHVQNQRKYFLIEFPYPDFLLSALKLRQYNFNTVYEIVHDWAEAHNKGEASWFKEAIENAIVINANLLIANSGQLAQKFSSLRKDIYLSNENNPTGDEQASELIALLEGGKWMSL